MKVLVLFAGLLAFIEPLQAIFLRHPCWGKNLNEVAYDRNSCRVFYFCNGKGNGQKHICPQGYYYNLVKGYCVSDGGNRYQCRLGDSPWGFTGNECKRPGVKQHLPYPGNCKLFIQCDNQKAVVKKCPENTHFNALLEVCDWPDQANCIKH